MASAKVYADFQNLDDFNRPCLTCAGTQADLVRQGIELRERLVLTLYMDDADDHGHPDELRARCRRSGGEDGIHYQNYRC